MLEFLVENIFAAFVGKFFFKQIVEIPTGTNFAPYLADLYPFCTHTKQTLHFLSSMERINHHLSSFFTYRYTDAVLSINGPDFENYLGKMYLVQLVIQDI